MLSDMTITMYSLPSDQCRACWSTERRLTAAGVEFDKIMLDANPDVYEVVAQLGHKEAPVVVVSEGDNILDHWSVYRETKIVALAAKVA